MVKANNKTETTAKETKVAAGPEVSGAPAESGAAALTASGGELAVMNFQADAGSGMEGATQESFAIPFLMVLQKGSPQVDEASGAAIDGAKQGMFFLNVSGKLMDGNKGVTVVPCAYRRVFLRWAPRETGGGFKGELLPEEVAQMRMEGKLAELDGKLYFPQTDGTVNPNKCDRVADVRNHYVLLLNEDGSWSQALMSMGSTQIKKSRMLMSALADVKLKGAGGIMYTPATWANKLRVTTVPEKNDKGSWMGLRFELDGQITRSDIYQAGRSFNEAVRKGGVEVKYEEQDDPTTVNAGSTREAAQHESGSGGGSF